MAADAAISKPSMVLASPDLILMDVAMPRMDGVQTLECLRAMEL
jgi:CheY-like chemotaxis protein